MLAGEYRRQITEGATLTDEAVKKFYDANSGDFSQVKLSHILILNADSPTVRGEKIPEALPEREARKRIEEVKTKMRDGANFEELAKQYSQDPGSADNGGDLGYISKGQMTPEVEKAAFALKEGSFSDIIESPFGFHILHVTEVKVTPLEEVRDQIRQKLGNDQLNGQIEAKIKGSDVKVDESFFQR